jgi:hypothetical protein
MKYDLVLASEEPQELELRGEQRLRLERGPDRDLIQLCDARGRLTLSIQVKDSGPVLRFEGEGLRIQAAGELTLEAEELHLHGRTGLNLTTGGDLALVADGDLASEARIQEIRAKLGNVNIAANDDVRIDGERVMVNC